MLYDFIAQNREDIPSRARQKVASRRWPAVSHDELENGCSGSLSTGLAQTNSELAIAVESTSLNSEVQAGRHFP